MNKQSCHYYPLTTQKASYTGTAAAISTAISNNVHVVRVVATTACYIAVGSSPTATTSDMYLPAAIPEYLTIHPGQKISAVQVAAGGDLYVTEMTQ